MRVRVAYNYEYGSHGLWRNVERSRKWLNFKNGLTQGGRAASFAIIEDVHWSEGMARTSLTCEIGFGSE